MATLKLSHIYKVYPNGVKAVNDFNLNVEDKEFIVFVGPSGCGKSTTLRMIAGLEDITAGELRIGGATVNNIEPKDRDIAMVFQNYALYPHMTVYNNMAFGLRLRKLPKTEIDKKVKEAAEILGITEYLDKKPNEMSGGQRQRVALGRAIVREPKVFLFDEPLSNLDAKLRTQMRSEILKLHRRLKTTFIYVTHDQVEAMTMGTRIVVMKDGFVQQIDTPRNLYRYPANKFVAGFIGTPQMNFYSGSLKREGDTVRVALFDANTTFDAPYSLFNKVNPKYLDGQKQIIIGLRAEFISVTPSGKNAYETECTVINVEELGNECLIYADFNTAAQEQVAESPTRVIIKAGADTEYVVGQVIKIYLDLSNMAVFDAETESSIMPRIPESVVVDGEVKGNALNMLGAKIRLPSAIKLSDGKYAVDIPLTALKLGGEIKGSVCAEEKIAGTRLVHLRTGDRTLFVVDSETDLSAADGVSIDIKQLSFIGNGHSFNAVPKYNRVDARLVKSKTEAKKTVRGKVKKIKLPKYSLEIAGCLIDYPKQSAEALVANFGNEIFKKELIVEFTPYCVKATESGVTASVDEFSDYGAESFIKCKIGEREAYVFTEGPIGGGVIKLAFSAEDLIIYEKERDIRLI